MKSCQICHHVADDDTATCPHCGEASWHTHASSPRDEAAEEPARPRPSGRPSARPRKEAS